MGQSKQRISRLLSQHSHCIFCRGSSLATTIDHQPARALFDARVWPEGYQFPACEPCNQLSKEAEHKLALLVRINSEREDDPVRRREFKKYVTAMNNNFPGLLKPLTANEKRRFMRREGVSRPAGLALADIHAAGIQGDMADSLFTVVIDKILRALHWKHTGKIVMWPEGVKATWYTNAYAHVFHGQVEERGFYTNLPACPAIRRSGRDLSDQFAYRYGKDEDGETSAFLIVFRQSIIVTGIVAQSSDVLDVIRRQDAEHNAQHPH